MSTTPHGPARPHVTHPTGGTTGLPATGEQLLGDARSAKSGRAARTVVALPGLRATLIALAAGHELAEHEAPGAAILICLAGQVTLSTADRTWPLEEGDLVPIPDQRHRLTAGTDALVLLTVRLARPSG